MSDIFAAVIGHTEDPDVTMWGFGESTDAAIDAAVREFVENVVRPGDCDPGAYEVIVYTHPVWETNANGDDEIVRYEERKTFMAEVSP